MLYVQSDNKFHVSVLELLFVLCGFLFFLLFLFLFVLLVLLVLLVLGSFFLLLLLILFLTLFLPSRLLICLVLRIRGRLMQCKIKISETWSRGLQKNILPDMDEKASDFLHKNISLSLHRCFFMTGVIFYIDEKFRQLLTKGTVGLCHSFFERSRLGPADPVEFATYAYVLFRCHNLIDRRP